MWDSALDNFKCAIFVDVLTVSAELEVLLYFEVLTKG